VVLIVAALVYAGGRKSAKRYRPGRGYDYAPVWFTSTATASGSEEPDSTQVALPGGLGAAALPAGAPASAMAVRTGMAVSAPGVTGGASDRW
jgi:hypothetical protein